MVPTFGGGDRRPLRYPFFLHSGPPPLDWEIRPLFEGIRLLLAFQLLSFFSFSLPFLF